MSSPRPTVPATMQALVAPRYGSADVLEVATSPVPEPGTSVAFPSVTLTDRENPVNPETLGSLG